MKIVCSSFKQPDWFDLPPPSHDTAMLQPSEQPSDPFDIESDELDERLLMQRDIDDDVADYFLFCLREVEP